MRVTAAATAMAATRSTFFAGRRFARAGCGERGKFLRDFGRAAVRTFRSLPIRRADEDFGIVFALGAMEFVNRHEGKIIYPGEITRRRISPFLSTASI
jgi:hypothetical protein